MSSLSLLDSKDVTKFLIVVVQSLPLLRHSVAIDCAIVPNAFEKQFKKKELSKNTSY